MSITPSHHLLHALGTTPSPPMPVRTAAAATTVTTEPVAPGREVTPPPESGAPERPAAPPRPGTRVDILA